MGDTHKDMQPVKLASAAQRICSFLIKRRRHERLQRSVTLYLTAQS